MSARSDSAQTRAVVWGTAGVGVAVAVVGFGYWLHAARGRIDDALARPTACEVIVVEADRDVATAWQSGILMEAEGSCAVMREKERAEAQYRAAEEAFVLAHGYRSGSIGERCAIANQAANDVPFDVSGSLGFLADRVLFENLIPEDLGPREAPFVCLDTIERSAEACALHTANFFRAMQKSLPRWPSQIDPSPRTIAVLTRCGADVTPAERRALAARAASLVSAARADRRKQPRARRLCALVTALGERGEPCDALTR